MNMAMFLGLICLVSLLAGLMLLRRGWRKAGSERVLQRLADGKMVAGEKKSWAPLEKELVRAGLPTSGSQRGFWLAFWGSASLLGWGLGGWMVLVAILVLPPLLLRGAVAVRYRRRLQRMIEQLPQFLDHVIRSLKSGRTLGDAMLLAMHGAGDPLRQALARSQRNIERGMPLSESLDDFAELYEREEFRILALGVRVNQRYGGNASELLENLIGMIRDRDKAARQLRAMTGETRITALILGALPVSLAGYIFFTNPAFLLGLWADATGRLILLIALLLQVFGSFLLWRMLRSI